MVHFPLPLPSHNKAPGSFPPLLSSSSPPPPAHFIKEWKKGPLSSSLDHVCCFFLLQYHPEQASLLLFSLLPTSSSFSCLKPFLPWASLPPSFFPCTHISYHVSVRKREREREQEKVEMGDAHASPFLRGRKAEENGGKGGSWNNTCCRPTGKRK